MSYLGRSGKLSLKAQEKVSFLATAGQTSKTGLSYVPSFVEVYVNGVLLTDTTDFTATNGNSVTFTVALLLNDEVTVISLKTFTVADHYSKTEADTLLATKLPLAGGTMTGALFIASPNQATGGSALQIRQGNNTPYGIDMGISQTTGDLNISKVNNGTSTHMMTLGRYSGNVGIGLTSGTGKLAVQGYVASGGQNYTLQLSDAVNSTFRIGHQSGLVNFISDQGIGLYTSSVERMRINSSGNVGINTSSPTAKLHIAGANAAAAVKIVGGATNGYYNLEIQNNTSNGYGVGFKDGGSIVGSIQTTGSATSYNTSSDYRLKENVVPMSGATAQTKLLKPCNFDWIAGGNVNGFIAHELAEVVPEAVSGTKDAMRDEEYEVNPATGDMFTPSIDAYVDADENEVEAVAEVIHSTDVEQPETLQESQQWRETTAAVMGTRSVPDMQGIDQSKLVPLLTATIQELIARIEALEGE